MKRYHWATKWKYRTLLFYIESLIESHITLVLTDERIIAGILTHIDPKIMNMTLDDHIIIPSKSIRYIIPSNPTIDLSYK